MKVIKFDWTKFGCNGEAVKELVEAMGFGVQDEVLKPGMRVTVRKANSPNDGRHGILIKKRQNNVWDLYLGFFTSAPYQCSYEEKDLECATRD